MPEDIRRKPFLTHQDIMGLNFIKTPPTYYFRRHFRAGLRSHIMELLHPEDLKKEKDGVLIDGFRTFPRARPLKVLRIFRKKFKNRREAEAEPRRVQLIESFLAPAHVARSEEFIVDYSGDFGRDTLLCGLQEYIEGEILDPWGHLDELHFISLYRRMSVDEGPQAAVLERRWLERIRNQGRAFVSQTRRLIREAGYVPDLAGVGNLILTRGGRIKLVDINNVSRVPPGGEIPLDDRGYPVYDKSMEALSLLAQKLAGNTGIEKDPLFRPFLDPGRMREVKALERLFHLDLPDGDTIARTPYPVP